MNRAGPGLAGAADGERRHDLERQLAGAMGGEAHTLQAMRTRFALRSALASAEAAGDPRPDGVSQKAAGRRPRLPLHLAHAARREPAHRARRASAYAVEGRAWMDHEFFTHQLEPDQTGWDWFSLQLDDGTDLMLYRLRRSDGKADPYSAGTFVAADGRVRCTCGRGTSR